MEKQRHGMHPVTWLRLQWDRVAGWSIIAAGGIALILGWFGASGMALPSGQLPYLISGGLGGLFLVGLGGTLLLSADLRDEWRKLDAIERHLVAVRRGQVEEAPEPKGRADAGHVEGNPSAANARALVPR